MPMVTMASVHAVAKIPDLHDWLKSSRSFYLVAGPSCLIISLHTSSLPGAFFVLSLMISSSRFGKICSHDGGAICLEACSYVPTSFLLCGEIVMVHSA